MADIKKELNDIKNAVYGREVRGSIHDGIKKINDEVENATDLSESAKHQVENIQQQVNQLVVEGDSSVEAAQARVDAEGKSFPTLKDRLDEKETQFSNDIDSRAINILKYSHLVVNDDWTAAIQAANDEGKNLWIPVGEFKFGGTVYFNSGFEIHGEDTYRSVLRRTSAEPAFVPKTKDSDVTEWVKFKNFRIWGFGNTGLAIDLTHCDHTEIIGCYIHNVAIGIKFEQDSEKGYIRNHYNTVMRNRISARDYGVWITGDKPNANRIEFNRFSGAGTGEHIGVFVEIDRGKDHGPVNTLSISNNYYTGLVDGIKTQYIISSTIEGNRFENVINGINWDKTSSGALATHRKLTINRNHYGTNVNAWIGTPDLNSCSINESAEDLLSTLPININFPHSTRIFGNGEYTGDMLINGDTETNHLKTSSLIFKNVATEVNRWGRSQQFVHSTRLEEDNVLRIRFQSDFNSMINMRVVVVGNIGMGDDRIIGMDKSFMFGLGENSFTSLQQNVIMSNNLESTDVTVSHVGSEYTFDLRIKHEYTRTYDTTVFIELSNSCSAGIEDGRINVKQIIND